MSEQLVEAEAASEIVGKFVYILSDWKGSRAWTKQPVEGFVITASLSSAAWLA